MELSTKELQEIYYVLGKVSLGQKNLELVDLPLVREVQTRVGKEMVERHRKEMEELDKKVSNITTIGELRKSIANFNDHDSVVVEVHEGVRSEDLYGFTIDEVERLTLVDGTIFSEVRICI